MSVNPSHLRIGNWIHCKGSSHYGVVTGEILAEMERDEKFREKFEPIELTPELLEAAGFIEMMVLNRHALTLTTVKGTFVSGKIGDRHYIEYTWVVSLSPLIYHIHDFQNIYFAAIGSELPLPESAKIIPQTINS